MSSRHRTVSTPAYGNRYTYGYFPVEELAVIYLQDRVPCLSDGLGVLKYVSSARTEIVPLTLSLVMHQVVELQPATVTETRLAYDEVKDFGVTDMGRGEPHKYAYRILREPLLTEELARMSSPYTLGRVDAATFQPCSSYESRSQDRYDIQMWTNARSSWTLASIFDGHMNHETVDFVSRKLPETVRRLLDACCQTSSALSPDAVTDVLARAITSVDEAIISDFQSLFPGGESFLMQAGMDQLRLSINDVEGGGTRYTKVARVLGGTTALIALFDESTAGLWVANLGDCCAVLGTKTGSSWQSTVVNAIHNGSNDAELQRIHCEHHNEPECVVDRRVLGWLAPTRGSSHTNMPSYAIPSADTVIRAAIGDAWLKLPAVYTEKIFVNVDAPWMQMHTLDKYTPRIKTPPYVSATPDVYYHKLRCDYQRRDSSDTFLILCSDGLIDLHRSTTSSQIENLAHRWVQIVGREVDKARSVGGKHINLAVRILREAIGGEDVHLSSRILTVEMEERWIDDTTIIVHRFT